ncbi:MAG TPA: hypothetical protein VII78_13995, partial [Myxococcota bacterium]
ALFALSGVAALIVQTLWLRELRLALGGASAAISATLAALVIGQAGGARLGERVAQRATNPLRAFGALTAFAALASLATPHLLGATTALLDTQYAALLPHPALLTLARGAVALLATLPATLALGALAPALFAATLGGPRTLAGTGVGLYALNALGGAAGAALATFVLMERLGLRGSLACGAALLAIGGAGALAASRRAGRVPPVALASTEPGASDAAAHSALPPALPRWLLQLAALSGFGSFAAQALFAQALGRVSNASGYAFGAVLVVALTCIGLGALFIYSRSRRARPQLALGVALAVTGGACFAFPAAFGAATGGLAGLAVPDPWPAYLLAFVALAVATTAPVLLPAACVFPSLLAAAALFSPRSGRGFAAVSARLLAWNALGAGAGALLAPSVLVPVLGLWGAIAFIGAAYLLGSLRPIARAASPRFALYAALLGALIFVVVRPGAQPASRVPPGARLVALEESAAGLVAVLEVDGGLALQLDNHYLLGGARDRVRQERQGHLPLLLHPNPERVLFLGSATGSSASAALAHTPASITLVEIVPGVARAARRWFRGENRGVYDDPRTRVVVDDARSFLRASPERFDVIVGDLFVPWQAGAGSLYSAEHFANARARLAGGGVFCQWLPLYQLTGQEFGIAVDSFAHAFPTPEIFRGDFYGTSPIAALCGRKGAERPEDWLAPRALAGSHDRWLAHPSGVASLYVGRARASELGALRETDAAPVLEFLAARSHSGSLREPYTGLAWARFAELARRNGPERSRVPAVEGGALLQTASALFASGRKAEAADTFARAAALLPPELVRDAPPDASAAELWHTLGD